MRYLLMVVMIFAISVKMDEANEAHWKSPQGQAEANANVDRLVAQLRKEKESL